MSCLVISAGASVVGSQIQEKPLAHMGVEEQPACPSKYSDQGTLLEQHWCPGCKHDLEMEPLSHL
jgi:hypothetical protein